MGTGSLPIGTLRGFKADVPEAREGSEWARQLGNYSDSKVDDVIETYEMREKPRS